MNYDQKVLETIRKKYHLNLILLHGSQVSGRLHSKSDVDIAVVRQKGHSKLDTLALISDFADIFASDRIDLADITHADPLFLYATTSQSTVLAGSLTDYHALQLKAFHRYENYKPYLRDEAELVKQKLQTYVAA